MFWGELGLLETIQKCFVEQLYNPPPKHDKTGALAFDTARCSSNISVSSSECSITQQKNKDWSTATVAKGFPPGSGVHRWSVHMEKCSKGNVFIGVVTSDASIDSYIGSDRHGWGFIGTPSLWHDHGKVTSDYGVKIAAGSVVHVTLDTDKKTLSYVISGTDWGVAFENLPDKILYPAVSLYQLGDSVSITSRSGHNNCSRPSTGSRTAGSDGETVEDIKIITKYFLSFFSEVDEILQCILKAEYSDEQRRHMLNHPFMVSLFPQLSASFASAKAGNRFISVRILPYLTFLTRMIAAVHEKFPAIGLSSHCDNRVPNCLVDDVCGEWKLESSAAGSIPAQTYYVSMTTCGRSSVRPIHFTGIGSSGVFSLKVVGTILGSRLQFHETWVDNDTCSVNARISLDGASFAGEYTTANNNGTIVGTRLFDRLSHYKNYCTSNSLLKAAMIDKSLVDILKESLFSSFQEFSDIERVPVRKKVRVECSSSRGDDGSRAKLIHDAWVSKVFSCIANDSISFNNESGNKHDDSELIVGVSASIPAFCQQLMDAKPTATITGSSGPSSALKLDQYIIHHTGMAALSRIGGDVLQNARRTVLAALVKHCGCATYCERIAAGITSGKLSSEDRPNSLLIQIWTSGQRVIEQSIRKKQLSGVSYSFLGQELCSKAMILFDIQPQTSTLEISEILSLSSFDGSTQNVYSSVQDTFAKILLDAVEFLQANITDLRHLKSALVKATVRGLYRTAGFRSLSLMLGKTEDRHSSSCEIAAPVISSTVLQETALQYVVVGIHASTDMTVLRNSLHCSISRKPTGIIPPSPAFTISSTQASHSIGARSNATSEDGNFGYYGEGLTGCSFEIFQELRSSIESLYDFITRFLERCTWGSDKKGQCTALACWNIHVKPEDHQFLNRCGVFKVLQSVLNDCRSASEDNAEGEESYVDKRELSEEENEVCHSHVIGARTSALERLSRLAMLTVHSLAAQVAFSKDIGRSVQSLGAPLQRQPSGPETLSRALFDMLFSELFFSFRQLISKTKENAKKILNAYDWTRRNEAQQLFSSISQLDGKTSSETNGQDAAMSAEFSLQGEEYIYRILRLLYGVSESEVCRRYLSSAKWMTLLFSGIGYGGIGVQRRLMRLLRRLLSTTDMSNMDCFVPKLFIFGENDLMDQPSPFDDDDSRMLLANDCNTEVSPSLSAQVDREDESSSGDFDFSGLMHIFGTHSLISAESVSILRLLLSHASWKDLTINVLEEPLRAWKASLERERVAGDELPREHGSLLPVDRILMRKISAVLGVTGGYPDRVREGGIVALKPMSLISNSGVESVALKLTALSHICGLVVDRGKLGGVDVLLVEPAGSRNIRPLSSSLQRDTDDAGVAPQGFVFSGSSPLKPIRVAGGDVTPISEILLNLDSLRYSFVESLLYFVSTKCLPEIISGIKSDDSSPQRFDNENEMMGVFVKTTSLRALSKCTESSNVVDAIIKSSPDHFLKIFPGVVDDPTPTVVYERKTTSNNPSPRLQRPDDASDRNRESHGDESPFGSSIGLSLLAGMRFGQQSQSPSDRSEAVLSGLFGLGGRSRASPPPQSPFGSSLTAISESAKRTMMEMGFRPEWCEAALRRSRNNVEIAINLCFEHGDDMDRLVQEDVTQQQQAAANRANSSAGSQVVVDQEAVQHMSNLGFPASWCVRALAASSNDPDAALNWILSHADDFARYEPSVDSGAVEANSSDDEDEETGSSTFGSSPLSLISGQGTFSDNLVCSANGEGSFPTIGCRGYAVESGKWYFEAQILTSGCIQIGWVDCGYIGMSENGQGVGDCLNSWCFDGWRVMLWHELSAEWGARWAPGNTVGCAVDMDERKMIFSLNGETESIGMGEAFQGFRCHGGLYPACSISQGQKIKYRFGPTGFKYPPPEGYRPYAEHIIHVNESKVATTPPNAARKSLSSTQMSANCENTIEEQQGESECDWHRRYFSVDDNQGLSLGGARSMQFPEPSFSRTVPGSLVEATKQFKALSMDLSILYARLTVLNVLKSSSSLHSFENFVKLLTTSALNDCGYTSLEAVIKLIRLSSITSNRSRVHLQTVSLMPRPTIDNNLGSIFSIGGFPAVGGLYGSLSSMLAKARSTGDCSMASTMLQQLRSELVRSTQRDHCSGWKLGTGLIPSVAKSGQLPDSLGSTLPSLNLAVGLTIVLISQLSSEIQAIVEVIPDKNSNFRNEESIFVRWAEEMCGHWCIGLQSPNIVVKLCCIRMLNALFQEFLISSSKHSVFFQSGFMCKLCNIIPLKRLEQFALNRIKHERGVSPVCSEFLQALLEFVNSVSIARTQILVNTGHATGEFLQEGMVEEKGHLNPYLDQSSIETGDDNMKFNWDAIEGSLVSDDSWDVWTGSIRHLPAELPSQHASCSSQNRSMRDRPQNQPPELLVGCKVARKKRVMSGDLVRPPTPPPAALDAQSQDDARDEEIPVRQADLQGLMDSNVVLSNDSDDEPRNSVGGVRNTLSNIRQRIAELESRQRASPLAEASEASHAPSSWARGFLSRPSGEQESAKNSTPSAPAVEFEWEIGTVVGIASHSDEGSLPGSARIIRWDSPGRMKKETVQRELSVTNEEIGSSDDGSDLETVSWGHNNVFDVVHVSLNRDGSINQQYPPPKTRFIRAVENGFGGDTTFGVILRLRSARKLPTDKEEGIADRFDGVLEFCDFGSTIYVTGTKWDDGAWAITEERLLIGSSHASWSVRFGQAHWKPGTTYDLAVANRSSVYNDKYNQALVGQFSIPVNVGPTAGKSFSVSGDIYLQKNNLFHFDENLRANAISLSLDKLSAFSDGKESRSTVFGNIGFTEGVHYWELKIEQGDIGNIFVGVAEKTWMPGQPSNLRLNRWLGSGFVNIRTSFKHTPSGTAERVYGDHFHTGDTVGVLLDMDRGRLSFFLDGLKYGEHSLTDLGEAFDGLTSTTTLRKALYPVVGMRRNLDRVTITPRWLSCYGPDANGILRTVRRSSSLLSSWNFERPATKPLARDMWIYREAWREHYRWNYRPIDRVRTRCKSPLLYVGVDVDPTACVEASIRLGLPMALFRGDRVTFTRSGGRLLEGGEEAVILGAYRGLLWYRLDTQHGGESRAITGGGDSSTPFVLEGASLAWQLCAQDVDGLVLCRRAGHVDPRIAALKLPRIPEYKGARLNVQFSSGAIMRDAAGTDMAAVFLRKTTPIADACTLESFIELAATFDGSTQWSVEADMQLSELISRIASKEGVSPLNVSAARVKEVCRGLDPTNVATSHLVHLDANRVIARAAVLRVANIVFGYSLPYIDVGLATTSIPTSGDMTRDEAEKESSAGGKPNDILSWQPPCDARKLRSLRRLMFSQTKSTFFESVLDMTMTPTPLPQDEYEEPREIKTIKVNRVMATTAKLSVIKNNSERLKVSVFGQLYKEMRGWPTSAYRRSYVGKGHGGQKRAFKVKFMGEGVNDYGGPYRAVFEQVVDEMQCDAGPVAGQKAWEKTLLTLLVPCPNRASAAGSNQDKFMFVPSNPSPPQQELMQFLGRLTGMAVRHNLNLGLDFSSLVWRPLVRLPVGRGHLNTVDSLAVSRLEKMEKLGIFLEKRMLTDNASFSPPDWADLTFSVYLSDGYTRVSLVEGGEQISVNVGNWREYIRLVEETRLREGSLMLKLFSDGLAAVLPVQLLPLFTGPELELMISGTRSVDVDLLQKCTEYENLQPDSELVRNFWSVLKEMDDDEKTLFLRFVWARSRMPATAQDFPMNFKLQAASTGDDFLPHAQTCFFSLALPAYGSKEALKEKLLYAINNSPNMDADVRLHNAEGWADS
ncbi:unnamed protein product [Ectocarpus fasciculatus]